jgi:hypothetical protein
MTLTLNRRVSAGPPLYIRFLQTHHQVAHCKVRGNMWSVGTPHCKSLQIATQRQTFCKNELHRAKVKSMNWISKRRRQNRSSYLSRLGRQSRNRLGKGERAFWHPQVYLVGVGDTGRPRSGINSLIRVDNRWYRLLSSERKQKVYPVNAKEGFTLTA